MIAVTIEIGDNLASTLATIVTAVVLIAQQIRTRRELKPNGGASLRDAVDRIDHQVAELAAVVQLRRKPPLPPPTRDPDQP